MRRSASMSLAEYNRSAPAPGDGAKSLVVGIGSPHGDDQAGWLAVRQLRATTPDAAQFATVMTPIEMLDMIREDQRLIICDACHGLGFVGSRHRLRWPLDCLWALPASTTHALGLVDTLQLAQSLGRLPMIVVIWAMEISTAPGPRSLSPEIVASLPDFVTAIHRECLSCTNDR